MNKSIEQQIEVYADWRGLDQSTFVGKLHVTRVRGKEIFSFEYSPEWLDKPDAHQLDPSLQLIPGRNYIANDQSNFGVFLDSSPDRWGRVLMGRREAYKARLEEREVEKLFESDYLLGVYDKHRIGGLRFKRQSDGPFLNDDEELASPPWTELRALEHASFALENDNAIRDPDYAKWLSMLIAPGGSLGGARPKASVVDEHKELWIAKFPSRHDSVNIGGWEQVVNKLAEKAGVIVPPSQVKKLNSKYHTFLSKRFDRIETGDRIHFCSAMTLLQRRDGDGAEEGVSYLDIAELIMQFSAEANKDLEQLWRRIVFNICVSNTDDHLRNHGFLLNTSNGWSLSPAYDMNPDPHGHGLKLNISNTDNAQNLDLAREVAPMFRVNDYNPLIDEIINAVRHWQDEAKKLEIPLSEQEQMRRAFRISET